MRRDQLSKSSQRIVQQLRERGHELDFCNLDQIQRPGQDVLSLLDIEAPFLYSAGEKDLSAFKSFIARIQNTRILWVTGEAQIGCHNPNSSLILGMARKIRAEHLIDFATLELEIFDDTVAWRATVDVLHEFQHRARDSKSDPTLEYALSHGRIQVSRYHWVSVSNELLSAKNESYPKRLEISKPGIMNILVWKQDELVDLEGDSVEVETRAVGLNFKVSILLYESLIRVSAK